MRHRLHRRVTHGRHKSAGILAFVAAMILVSCGQSDEQPAVVVTESRPAPPASSFPQADGKTLNEVLAAADRPDPSDPVIQPLAQVFYPGTRTNRYPFSLTDRDGYEVVDAEVAFYIAPVPPRGNAFDRPARGPYAAQLISLATDSAFRSETTVENPFVASAFYLAEIPFPRRGQYRIAALIRHGDRLIAKTPPSVDVGSYTGIPTPGMSAPVIATPTPDLPGVGTEDLTTRRPPGTLQEADAEEVLGSKPLVLLFTSPRYCPSRVCAPLADIAEQAKDEYGGRVEFIHMDIYLENDPNRGVRPQIRRYNLPGEPWTFVIDERGVVRRAVEGPIGYAELTRYVEEAST